MRTWEPGFARPGKLVNGFRMAHCYVRDCGAWLGCGVRPGPPDGAAILNTFPGFKLEDGVVRPLLRPRRRAPSPTAHMGRGTWAPLPVDVICQGCGRRQTIDAEHLDL